MAILMAVFLFLAPSDSGSQRTITLSVVTGHDRITFNTARMSEKEVRRWIMLSPHVADSNSYLVPEPLELCIEKYPEYRKCGTRDWRAKNFIFNADANLQKIRERIKELDESSYPRELGRVVSYFKTIQEDDLFFQSQLLKFVQEWRTEDLAKSFDGIDPGQQCSVEIMRIRTAPDEDAAYRLASKGWRNCINHALRGRIGEYPEADWKEFLHRYLIREEFLAEDVD